MFICPETGCRLVRAQVKGGMFWYSPESDGRLLTIPTFKNFLGEHAGNEIWMRSENSPLSALKCPGCRKQMHNVDVPKWIGDNAIDICRSCWMVWIESNEYHQIPLGSDIDKNVEAIKAKAGIVAAEIIALENDKIDAVPDSALHSLPGFLSLPVKTVTNGLPIKTLTICVFALILLKHLSFPTFFDMGFYIFSIYFFYLFSSDIEIEIGHLTYAILTFGSLSISFFFAQYLGNEFHYFDMIALVYALMVFSLLFPIKARFSYLIPFVHYLDVSAGSSTTLPVPGAFAFIKANRWVAIPQWLVVAIFVLLSCSFIYLNANINSSGSIKKLIFMQIIWGLVFRALLYVRKPYNQL